MNLKKYQQSTLDTLTAFLKQCRERSTDNARGEPTRYLHEAFAASEPSGGQQAYFDAPFEGVRGVPNVCFRIPTGGGKTLLAAHAISITAAEWLRTDTPVVLWLAPSGKIVEQTLTALRNPRHSYHQALREKFPIVNVVSIDEALRLNASTLREGVTIIVSTMQAFRRDSKDGLRVYAGNGSLMTHFDGLSQGITASLLKNSESGVEGGVAERSFDHSLANVLRLHRPIVIVDEAHNAKTKLSFDTLSRLSLACVLEFTATPNTTLNEREEKYPSNILVSVAARELANEEMIKMPLWVDTRTTWERTLADAVARLNMLHAAAESEVEYIRPMMLIKAQSGSGAELSPERIKAHLQASEGIPAEAIAIEADSTAELAGVDVMRRDCKVRFVITKEKLREGWDCPFAYVLCVLQNITSETSVEQFVGRVLRLPYARRHRNDALNKGYVFSLNDHSALNDTLGALERALVQSGFNQQEARELLHTDENAQQSAFEDDEMTLFGAENSTASVECSEVPDITALSDALRSKLHFDSASQRLALAENVSELSDEETAELERAFQTDVGKGTARRLQAKARHFKQKLKQRKPSPCEMGIEFAIPALVVKRAQGVMRFDEEFIIENADYSFDLTAIHLTNEEFPDQETHRKGEGEIMLDDGKVRTKHRSEAQALEERQAMLWSGLRTFDEGTLVRWLDGKLSTRGVIEKPHSLEAIRALVRHLEQKRGIPFVELLRRKYELASVVQTWIQEHIRRAEGTLFDMMLHSDELHADPAITFQMPPEGVYGSFPAYSGSHCFEKHYYHIIPAMERTEERFAVELDSNPKIQCWLRNISQHPKSFYLVYDGVKRFYPDFVCKTAKDAYLVVEPHQKAKADFIAKDHVGKRWAERSQGRCAFVMMDWNDVGALHKTLAQI